MVHILTPSIEDYLSTIYRLDRGEGVRSVDVSKQLKVSKPSVNRALKTLSDLGFVTQVPYGDIFLTDKGRKKAIELNKKYAILKGFLVHMLGLDDKRAEYEAGEMEHGMSTDTIQRIGNLMKAYSMHEENSSFKTAVTKEDDKSSQK